MRSIVAALPFLLLAFPAMAQDRSRHLEEVVGCSKIADAAERLACYDKAVAALDTAERDKRVVVVDKEQVTEAKRTVFGLKLPVIKLFEGSGGDDIDEIESTVATVTRQADGKIFFTIADGARWVQTDSFPLVGVRVGTKVTLKRGTFGTFFAKFQGSSSARVARVN